MKELDHSDGELVSASIVMDDSEPAGLESKDTCKPCVNVVTRPRV